MKILTIFISPVLITLITMLLGAGIVFATEVDDTALFVEAFHAFQEKDYLLAVEKASRLNQIFPDSSLRDVTLLLIARSCIKSGDNQLAAKSINKFRDEFSNSGLTSTIEEEIFALGDRQLKGETLQSDKQLQAAAQKIRDDFRAAEIQLEKLAREKAEQERISQEKAELERIAREKAESERKERERLAAEKAAKESIKLAVSLKNKEVVVAAGQNGSMPVEISNTGKNNEEFVTEVSAAPEYEVHLTAEGKPDETVTRVKLASGEAFKGKIFFRMPSGKVDGHREALTIKTISSKYNDVFQVKHALVITSAPLVRVVAKLAKPKVTPGEQLRYKVTILNIGSLHAQDLTIRLQLPTQLDFLGAPNVGYKLEKNGTPVFKIERIETGKLLDFYLDVRVKEDSRIGQELRGQVEVVNGQLLNKEIFTSGLSVVQAK